MSNVVDFVPRKDAECRSWNSEPATIIILPVVRIERMQAYNAMRERLARGPIRIGPMITIPICSNFVGYTFRPDR